MHPRGCFPEREERLVTPTPMMPREHWSGSEGGNGAQGMGWLLNEALMEVGGHL